MGHGDRGEDASRSETRHPPSEHQSVDDDVLEGRLAEQSGGQHQQGVEPGGQRERERESHRPGQGSVQCAMGAYIIEGGGGPKPQGAPTPSP